MSKNRSMHDRNMNFRSVATIRKEKQDSLQELFNVIALTWPYGDKNREKSKTLVNQRIKLLTRPSWYTHTYPTNLERFKFQLSQAVSKKQLEDILGVSSKTISSWANAGRICAWRRPKEGYMIWFANVLDRDLAESKLRAKVATE